MNKWWDVGNKLKSVYTLNEYGEALPILQKLSDIAEFYNFGRSVYAARWIYDELEHCNLPRYEVDDSNNALELYFDDDMKNMLGWEYGMEFVDETIKT